VNNVTDFNFKPEAKWRMEFNIVCQGY